MNSLRADYPIPRRPSRAKEMVNQALSLYNAHKINREPDQNIELLCAFDGLTIAPDSIGSRDGDFIDLVISEGPSSGSQFIIPVEKMSVWVSVTVKQSAPAPKEIGFHTGNQKAKGS